MNEALRKLPDSLLRCAYWAVDAPAWRRHQALEVIQCSTERELAILGVEVWIPRPGGPEIPAPFIYSWTAAPNARANTWLSFVTLANDAALAYVREFGWDPLDTAYRDSEPYFSLEIATRDDCPSAAGHET